MSRATFTPLARRTFVLGLLMAGLALPGSAKSKPRPAAVPVPSPSPCPTPAPAQPPEARRGLEIKWVRDSGEYAAAARQVYLFAAQAVSAGAASARAEDARRGVATGPLAVVLDLDETALDNSVYQLERDTYGLDFDAGSWDAWVERGQAGAVPGAADFVAGARALGVRVVWLSNRDHAAADVTRRNMQALGLWGADDTLCLKVDRASSDKAARRAQVRSGDGACGLGAPARVLAYVGDQLGDFPADGEESEPARRAECVGARCFLLPNPMYGSWTRAVTRPRP